ncbi:MAG: tetratricopeptide repeat protein [Bacteroidota bacterium]
MKRICLLTLFLTVLFAGCDGPARLSTSSPEALRAYEEGVHLFQNFYYGEARTAFERALGGDSLFAMGWLRLGVLSYHVEDNLRAQRDIRRALDLSAPATRREQLFIRMWYNRVFYDAAGAEAAADTLLAEYPDEVEARMFKGHLLELRQKPDEAIREYRRALETDPSFAPAVMLLGYAYSSINEQEKAIRQMERYIEMAPDAADPRASYADLLIRVGRYEEALDQYERSLELKPDYWYSLGQIGTIYSWLGRLKDAERRHRQATDILASGPVGEAQHAGFVAGLHMMRHAFPDAERAYREALVLDSTNLTAHFGLIQALARMGRFEEAHAVADSLDAELERRRLKGTQIMQGFHTARAMLLLEEGRYEEARGECSRALEFAVPISRPSVFRILADIHYRQGQLEEALGACEEALRINPQGPSVLFLLVKVYAAQGEGRMTHEIGARLKELWRNADGDFANALELRALLARVTVPPS